MDNDSIRTIKIPSNNIDNDTAITRITTNLSDDEPVIHGVSTPKPPSTIRRFSERHAELTESGKHYPNVLAFKIIEHHQKNLIRKLKAPEGFSRSSTNGAGMKEDAETGQTTDHADNNNRYKFSFVELHHIHVRKLQCQLMKVITEMCIEKKDVGGKGEWEDLLQQYIQAVKDFDYMTECSKRARDPFFASGQYCNDHQALKQILKETALESKFSDLVFKEEKSSVSWDALPENGEATVATTLGPRNEGLRILATKAFYKRLITAAIAASFLLGPMWLMAEYPTRGTALWGTTCWVLAFGLAMAGWLEKDVEVMSSTAAYAAVLVVFVGLILEDRAK